MGGGAPRPPEEAQAGDPGYPEFLVSREVAQEAASHEDPIEPLATSGLRKLIIVLQQEDASAVNRVRDLQDPARMELQKEKGW